MPESSFIELYNRSAHDFLCSTGKSVTAIKLLKQITC
jgi:hypothetical protein